MELFDFFEAIGAYFQLPIYAVLYFIESYVNSFAEVIQALAVIVFGGLEGLEAGLNALASFVSWLPSLTFGLIILISGLLLLVVLIRVVTKVIETLPGGFGGWLK